MSDVGDLVAHLSAEDDGFSVVMNEAANVTEQTTIVIHEQRAAWSALAVAAVPALGQITASGLGLAATLASISHQKAIIASIAAPFAAAGTAATKYGALALRAVSMVIPQARLAALAVSALTASWKVGGWVAGSDAGQKAITKIGQSANEVGDATGRLFSQLGDMISSPFVDGSAAVGSLVAEFLHLEEFSKWVTKSISESFKKAGKEIDDVTHWLEQCQDAAGTLLHVFETGVDIKAAEAFYNQAGALRELAKESERVIALQEQQQVLFKQVGEIQRNATANAEHTAEVQRLATLKNVEAIDNETRALQERTRELVQSGKMDEDALQRTTDLFNAIERRRAQLKNDEPEKVQKTPVDSLLEQAQQSLDRLRLGEDGAAIAAARAAGATDQQVEALRRLQTEIGAVNVAQEAAKAIEDSLRQSTEQRQLLQQQGLDRISQMRDQIDLLSGAATAAEIEMKNLFAQGFAADQVAEIGALMDELERLQKTKESNERLKSDVAQSGKPGNSLALAGSQNAASIMLRGTGNQDSALERYAKKQIELQQQQLAATKSLQPPPIMVANF